MKYAIIHDIDYTVYIEPVDFGHIVHCDVFKWSPGVMRKLKADFDTFQSIYRRELYAAHFREDHEVPKKHLKFLKLYGFKPWRLATAFDGRECTLFVKEYIDG